ncbi:MAG: DUF3536 domain-containing protein [Thermoanaerobaculia bacterium]
MPERFICIHGHFYQPPRENPWLDTVESEDSAYPYHDWNARITAECYGPNATSRILDDEGWITRIVNNYAKISYNFGPTLLSWLQEKAPDVYHEILVADLESQGHFSGHGSAMAQAYNHAILPLANRRDKETQIIWGIRDFESRFQRKPEGMWLPETAVDIESLELMAERGIIFTVLEPHQASRIRKIGETPWDDVNGGRIDPTRPYRIFLPSGRTMAIFFYDGPISRGVAFERLLARGEHLADRLVGAFNSAREWPQIVHIATDGETYGHHHRHGDMALAYALDYIERRNLAKLTNYGEYLAKFPPAYEVEIHERTSWSCAHGIERWRSNCGCHTGGPPEWNQQWREPLRKALDWLRDVLSALYDDAARRYLKDPWAARNAYIELVLDRSNGAVERFLQAHAKNPEIERDEITSTLKLLEMQRNAMLMYTSCGWFFNELSGIETVQVLRYAARAIQLAGEFAGEPLEPPFLERLSLAKSNVADLKDGRRIYERNVQPAVVDLARVGAHYAITSIFEEYPDEGSIYCYRVRRQDYESTDIGRQKLAIGRARITSEITRESAVLTFGVLYLGDVNLTGGVREFRGTDEYERLKAELPEPVEHGDFPGVIRLFDKHFGSLTFSIKSLFRDEQRRILGLVWNATLAEAEGAFRQFHDRYVPFMRYHTELGIPLPAVLKLAAEFDLNLRLQHAFERDDLPLSQIKNLLKQAKSESVLLDHQTLAYTLKVTEERLAERLSSNPYDLATLRQLDAAIRLARSLTFEVDVWKAQNEYYRMLEETLPEFESQFESGGEEARAWLEVFSSLGDHLKVKHHELTAHKRARLEKQLEY